MTTRRTTTQETDSGSSSDTTTTTKAISAGEDGSNTDNSGNSGDSIEDYLIVIIIVCLTIIIIILGIVFAMYKHSAQKRQDLIKKEIEIKKLSLQQTSKLHETSIASTSGTNPGLAITTDVSNHKYGTINNTGDMVGALIANENNRDNNRSLLLAEGNGAAADAGVGDVGGVGGVGGVAPDLINLPAQPQLNESLAGVVTAGRSNDDLHAEGVSGNQTGSQMAMSMAMAVRPKEMYDDHDMPGAPGLGLALAVSGDGDGDGDGGGNNNINPGGMRTDELNVNLNEKRYQDWNQREVLNWIETNLMNNGMSKDKINSFLKEFETQFVTGKMLIQLKNNDTLLKSLQFQFTKENQAFGIWMIIGTAINNIAEFAE